MHDSDNGSNESPSTAPPDPNTPRYTCPDCYRQYQAKETLQRHRKNHSSPVAHCCEVCKASFVRRDLLLRHYRIHQGDGPKGSLSRDRQRSRHACDRCSKLKIKCTSMLPACSNCEQRNTTCNYSSCHPSQATGSRLNSAKAHALRQTSPQKERPKKRSNMDDDLDLDVAGTLPRTHHLQIKPRR